jgi:hypothetical protein
MNSSQQIIICYDNTLHLIRSLVNLCNIGTPHHSLQRVFPAVAATAEDLNYVRRDLHGHVRLVRTFFI